MRRPRFSTWVLIATAAAILAIWLSGSEQETARPNVLLIMLDDMGVNDLGANGNPDARTPHLDQLAAQGIHYTRHYASNNCATARVALLTGTHPARHGFRPSNLGLSPDTVTLADSLRGAGYLTKHIGKWHVGIPTLEQSPGQLGFEDWFGFLFQSDLRDPSLRRQFASKPTYIDPWLSHNAGAPERHEGHLTDILTRHAVDFIENHGASERPWFVNLWLYAPHTPLQPASRFAQLFADDDAGRYRALLAQADEGIGRVMAALERTGQANNTLVLVLSDNGATNAEVDSNHPFRGKKTEFHEGSFRTPLLLRWPARMPGSGISDEVVSLYDLFPTIAAAAGAVMPQGLAGRNLLQEEPLGEAPLFWEYSNSVRHTYSVLSGDGRWRFTNGNYIAPVLNDLRADPSGQDNAIDANPDIAAKLDAEYRAWRLKQRIVQTSYEPLNHSGGALLRGSDVQRSPGTRGFTFTVGVAPEGGDPGMIAAQVGRWHLETSTSGLHAQILGLKLNGPALVAGQCNEIVLTSHFHRSIFYPTKAWAHIGLVVNGVEVDSKRVNQPPMNTWGLSNPTWIGVDPDGGTAFPGSLGTPVILNERLVPDEQAQLIGNGLGTAPVYCPDGTNNLQEAAVQSPSKLVSPAPRTAARVD